MRAATKAFADAETRIAMNSLTANYWQAAGEGRLTICRCGQCGRFRAPPTPYCPHCLSKQATWPTLSGAAELYSFTVVNRSRDPSAPDYYVAAVVKLRDAPGVKLVTNVVTGDIDALAIGDALCVRFQPLAEGAGMPYFVPRERSVMRDEESSPTAAITPAASRRRAPISFRRPRHSAFCAWTCWRME